MNLYRRNFMFPLVILFCSAAFAGEIYCPLNEEEQKSPPSILTETEIDTYLTATLKRHQSLEWFSADLVQIKSGGIFKRPNEQKGTIKVEMPNKLVLDMSDDGVMIVADGTYLWIYDTDLDEVERWDTAGYEKSGGESLDMAGMLLGADVKTVEEMHELYNITAVYADGFITYVLLPIKGKPAENYSRIVFTITEDALLPVRTVMTTIQKEGDTQPPAVVEYQISNLKSNSDGLKAFPPFTFIFPLTREIEVHDMDPEGGETVIPYEDAKKELEEMIMSPESNEEIQG